MPLPIPLTNENHSAYAVDWFSVHTDWFSVLDASAELFLNEVGINEKTDA